MTRKYEQIARQNMKIERKVEYRFKGGIMMMERVEKRIEIINV